jgi:hypothetical protein
LPKKRRHSLRVKTEQKFYRPGHGVDGRWVDNPTSPSEEMNHGNPKLPQYVQYVKTKKPGDEGAKTLVDVDRTSKNHQDDITANSDNNAEAIKNDYGTYVEDLYYDSDKTVELPEDPNEVFIYQTFVETDEEDDDNEDGATVGDTVGDNDEVV